MTDGAEITTQAYRILMIAPTSFFSDYGCSVRILEEARVLQRLGHEVTVCTYRNGQNVPGLTIRRTPGIPFREHYEVGSSPHKIGFDLLLLFTVLVTAVRRRPDVIHAHMHEGALIGLLVGGLLRIPMVFDFQGSLTGEMLDHKFLHRDSVFYRPLYWLETVIDRLAPAIVTSSHNAKRLLIDRFGCKPDQVDAVADCVDLQVFYPTHPDERPLLERRRAELGIPAHRCVVVYLGLLADYQGTDALLHAAEQLLKRRADVHFLIMGFPSVEHYLGMARALGIADHVTFTGKIPYRHARDYLALGNVAVAPKMSATEGSGKILNYMALGLPTVTFDTAVSREYLGDHGFYAQPGDPTSLADALHAALSQSDSVQRGTVLRHLAVEHYTWDCAAQTILHAYDRVCQRQPVVL